MIAMVKRHLMREWLLQIRQVRMIINSCLFFMMILIFFPLTMPSDVSLLRSLAPGLVWIAALLAFFLSSDRLFQQDYDDGVIEQWLVSGHFLSLFIAAKVLVHWVVNLLPMLIFCPVLALLFNLNAHEMLIMMVSLLCGTPAIIFLCALAAAFSTGLKQKGMVMALILMPLTIPVMIFGSGAVNAALQDLPVQGYVAIMLAISIIATSCLPFAISAVVRIGLVD